MTGLIFRTFAASAVTELILPPFFRYSSVSTRPIRHTSSRFCVRCAASADAGVAFAPKPRDYSYTLNKKVKRLALKSVLSAKAQEENVVVIDEIKLDAIKTKPMASFLKAVGADTKALVVTAENNEVVVKSAANIPGVLVTFANLINVYDILNAKKLVVDKAALAKIEEVFA